MAPDNTAMKQLSAIQQRRGHVTLNEIKLVYPIDSMTPEEIGRTMTELEEAGIEIEVDKDLLRRRAGWEPPTSRGLLASSQASRTPRGRWVGTRIKGLPCSDPPPRLCRRCLRASLGGDLASDGSPLSFWLWWLSALC